MQAERRVERDGEKRRGGRGFVRGGVGGWGGREGAEAMAAIVKMEAG